MALLPFSIRRIWLLARGSFVDRDNPRFPQLAAIEDSERFVWAILPHAARSFAPSILLLPEAEARAAAVGYLYARMLDTYEDLGDTPLASQEALSSFARRFGTDRPGAPPRAPTPTHPDARDRAHLLLLERCELVDEVYMQLDRETRKRIALLITNMASGMIEFSGVFEAQGGVLRDEQQVLDYCHRVIGLPALFVMELLLGDLSGDHERDALEVSELIQLANITRDIEKDLLRGFAYHPALEPHLGSDGAEVAADVASARRELMLLATRRSPSFRRLVNSADLGWLSPARAAAVMMMLFTDRHYRACAVAAGMTTWSGPSRLPMMIFVSLPAAVLPWWAGRILLRVERDLLSAA
ncbi:MAG: squalene/phytoene synthase family protein [Acidimicrobiia bacterium]